MEEPVCEPPAVALYYLARLASEQVKVVMSGGGGDEAFAGYASYRTLVWLERMKRYAGRGAPALARALAVVASIRRFERLKRN